MKKMKCRIKKNECHPSAKYQVGISWSREKNSSRKKQVKLFIENPFEFVTHVHKKDTIPFLPGVCA